LGAFVPEYGFYNTVYTHLLLESGSKKRRNGVGASRDGTIDPMNGKSFGETEL